MTCTNAAHHGVPVGERGSSLEHRAAAGADLNAWGMSDALHAQAEVSNRTARYTTSMGKGTCR